MMRLDYNPAVQACDLARNGKSLLDDPTLKTACLLSLFTRRLASTDDTLPTPASTREGWWADAYADIAGDLWGSRLWLLSRAKPLPEVLSEAKVYVLEALQWLVDDGVAATVDCNVEWQTLPGGVDKLLAVQPIITKPNDPTRWSAVWLANLALL
jgi:phage gp46-like protein